MPQPFLKKQTFEKLYINVEGNSQGNLSFVTVKAAIKREIESFASCQKRPGVCMSVIIRVNVCRGLCPC